eukprot:CAMPEP_0182813068 /NCGR_PEP_ID=MMETSP0006_2-20121128/9142_1 /TAXON_ID=97485 /ORGANISM="Prymnesium parvum, Strain Texoma1" /LENGTH=149 /DNA_ID=CAMNT_0024939139 /DNA_START=211 /DNA_END=657 /DNA_ORIENTATION=+
MRCDHAHGCQGRELQPFLEKSYRPLRVSAGWMRAAAAMARWHLVCLRGLVSSEAVPPRRLALASLEAHPTERRGQRARRRVRRVEAQRIPPHLPRRTHVLLLVVDEEQLRRLHARRDGAQPLEEDLVDPRLGLGGAHLLRDDDERRVRG